MSPVTTPRSRVTGHGTMSGRPRSSAPPAQDERDDEAHERPADQAGEGPGVADPRRGGRTPSSHAPNTTPPAQASPNTATSKRSWVMPTARPKMRHRYEDREVIQRHADERSGLVRDEAPGGRGRRRGEDRPDEQERQGRRVGEGPHRVRDRKLEGEGDRRDRLADDHEPQEPDDRTRHDLAPPPSLVRSLACTGSRRPGARLRRLGAWRSLVAHLNGVQEVERSNRSAPTTHLSTK